MNTRPDQVMRTLTRHPAVYGSALLIILAMLVGFAYLHGRKLALANTERALDERVNAHKYYLQDALGKFSLAPEIIANMPEVKEALAKPTPENSESLGRLFDDLARGTQADRIFLMNAAGTALAANVGPKLPAIIGENYRVRPYFQQAIAGQSGHFVGVGLASHVLGLFLSRPVTIEGKIVGVVAVRVSLSLEVFRSILKQYWKDKAEVALIADEHGVIFSSPLDQWMYHTMTPLPGGVSRELAVGHQYGDRKLLPLAMQIGDALTDEVRFVRFADIPNQVFLQKSYSIGEIGDRVYLNVNASQYWEPVVSYTIIAALIALATLLVTFAGVQRWCYRTKLVEAAIHDPLTGLYTRLYMNDWIKNALRAHHRDEGAGFALILFDLDEFKQVNDKHGHLVGDAVLKEVGRLITSSVRADAMAVRYGGEELALFVRYTDSQEVLALAERIRGRLEQAGVETSAGRLAVTISAGVAFHQPAESPNDLFARADEKMYKAKELGRNRICS
jgi:two-component system, NtrC family, C4-dicarboxylate transport sensor histidine kinase DctB